MDLFVFLLFFLDKAPTLHQTLLAAFMEAWKEGAGQTKRWIYCLQLWIY